MSYAWHSDALIPVTREGVLSDNLNFLCTAMWYMFNWMPNGLPQTFILASQPMNDNERYFETEEDELR